MAFFGLKLGLDLEMRAAHLHQKFQTAPPPGERDGFWIPKLIETYSCGAKNEKEIWYRILDNREVSVKFLQSLKSDHDMAD